MRRASLRAIAETAGVSRTTASFVLNGKGDQFKINKETQARILEVAQSLNYKPSFLAQTLSTGKTKTIGVLLDPSVPITSTLLSELVKELQDAGFRVLPGIPSSSCSIDSIIDDFIQRQVEALISIGTQNLTDIEQEIPISSFVISADRGATPGLRYDYTLMMQLLVHRNLQKHRKAMGFVGYKDTDGDILDIYNEEYTERFGIANPYYCLLEKGEAVEKAITNLVDRGVNAIMFASPALAGDAVRWLQSSRIASFESIEYSCIGWDPKLSYSFPVVHGVDLDPVKYATKITKLIKGEREHGSGESLFRIYP